MADFQNKRILIFGASSWLGSLLVDQLKSLDTTLAGTIYSNDIFLGKEVKKYSVSNVETTRVALRDFRPQLIINFLRGEDEEGFAIHNEIIEYAQDNAAYYMYASSVLALDGYSLETPLVESLMANSISDYGKFKAKCETSLLESNVNHSIIRFASVQGWVEHKLIRNEALLKKLKSNQYITVDKGVIQNRMSAATLISGLVALLLREEEGVFHFGTEDSSDEIDFLRAQAKQFGYDPQLIKEGKERHVNLVAIPNKIQKIMGASYKSFEKDTLRDLLQCEGLKKYIKNN